MRYPRTIFHSPGSACGCFVSFGTSEKKIHEFYDRWKAPVFRLCVLFLGDEERATDATGQAFLRYVKEIPDASNNQLPHGLVRLALEAARQLCVTPAPLARSGGLSFQEAILMLPCEQRAAFILRSVLGLNVEAISEAMGLGSNLVRSLWFQAVLRLRELLPTKFFVERCQ